MDVKEKRPNGGSIRLNLCLHKERQNLIALQASPPADKAVQVAADMLGHVGGARGEAETHERCQFPRRGRCRVALPTVPPRHQMLAERVRESLGTHQAVVEPPTVLETPLLSALPEEHPARVLPVETTVYAAVLLSRCYLGTRHISPANTAPHHRTTTAPYTPKS